MQKDKNKKYYTDFDRWFLAAFLNIFKSTSNANCVRGRGEGRNEKRESAFPSPPLPLPHPSLASFIAAVAADLLKYAELAKLQHKWSNSRQHSLAADTLLSSLSLSPSLSHSVALLLLQEIHEKYSLLLALKATTGLNINRKYYFIHSVEVKWN